MKILNLNPLHKINPHAGEQTIQRYFLLLPCSIYNAIKDPTVKLVHCDGIEFSNNNLSENKNHSFERVPGQHLKDVAMNSAVSNWFS